MHWHPFYYTCLLDVQISWICCSKAHTDQSILVFALMFNVDRNIPVPNRGGIRPRESQGKPAAC